MLKSHPALRMTTRKQELFLDAIEISIVMLRIAYDRTRDIVDDL